MRSDSELLDAWKSGDRAAGNELFQRHFEAIRRFFVNKVDRREVEDLVQKTFEVCIEARDRFRGQSSFRNFLLGIANNKLREFIRAKGRSRTTDFETQSIVDLGAGPSTMLAGTQEQRLLLEGLRRTPLDSQVVLELYYWERLSGRELGEVLGIPEDTARSRIRRAKDLLHRALRSIEESPEVLQSTMEDLEGWAAKIRAGFDPRK
ncbi:MAG: sigma-70 family RNA polymerase sigma factor [Myxococcales bacterium]|nr:sigma-70 family RNA polymerase sigma factor [Myxococcales bacterium]